MPISCFTAGLGNTVCIVVALCSVFGASQVVMGNGSHLHGQRSRLCMLGQFSAVATSIELRMALGPQSWSRRLFAGGCLSRWSGVPRLRSVNEELRLPIGGFVVFHSTVGAVGNQHIGLQFEPL